MKEKILEALKKLDPTNDNQWTQDGLPKLEALKFMMGGENATREQVNEAAPGFTRDNPIIGDGSNGDNTASGEQTASVQQDQPTQEPTPDATINSPAETASEEQTAQAGETASVVTHNPPSNKLTIDVAVNFPELIKNFLMGLDFVDVKELSDEDLAELAAKHSDILSADNQFLSEVNEFVTKRALYLNEVVEEQSKRVPPQSQADILAAFHNSVHANEANLPINKARQVQNRGPQFFGK